MDLTYIRLGYACINQTLRDGKPSICINKTCIQRTFEKKGKQYAIDLAKQNLKNVISILEWNEHQAFSPIRLYRMSSSMFPHLTNGRFIPEGDKVAYDLEQFSEYFTRIGELADRYKHRLTFHPGQYNQIGTPHESVFHNTVLDLSAHAKILDLCHRDLNSIMVLHGGGSYGYKDKTLERWIANFDTLPSFVKDRIVIENCERQYNYKDMLYLSSRIHRPFVFDIHHHECYSKYISSYITSTGNTFKALAYPETFLDEVVSTWTKCNLKPKFHISEQHPDKKLGAHSNYVSKIPDYLLRLSYKLKDKDGIDIMIEAKQKEKAVISLQHKYYKSKHKFPIILPK